MTRLQAELHRLYFPPAGPIEAAAAASLLDPEGRVRVALLALTGPADWTLLSTVWRGVQAELELPAPAIAVAGQGGYQLWFSFVEPTALGLAKSFVEALQLRYLGGVASGRVSTLAPCRADLPPRQMDVQQDFWSAFVAPDLAPVFAAEPWLDIPPSPEGQADLLCRLESIKPAALQLALSRLGVQVFSPPSLLAEPAGTATATASLDPTSFLLKVMNDESVAMALRIEAAKALLQAKK